MNKEIKGIIAIIITVILWGLSFLSSKVIIREIPPIHTAFIRFFIASIIMLAITYFTGRIVKVKKKDFILFIIGGSLGVTSYFYFENSALKNLNASTVSILLATIPIFSLFMNSIYYKLRISIKQFAGVMLSVIGVYVLVKSDISKSMPNVKGYLFVTLAALSWVLYSFINSKLTKKYNSFIITTYEMISGTIIMFPLTFLEGKFVITHPHLIALNFAYLAIGCSAIGYLLYSISLKYIGSTITTTFINLQAVVSCIGAYFILGENITFNMIIGIVIVILGIYIVTYAHKQVVIE